MESKHICNSIIAPSLCEKSLKKKKGRPPIYHTKEEEYQARLKNSKTWYYNNKEKVLNRMKTNYAKDRDYPVNHYNKNKKPELTNSNDNILCKRDDITNIVKQIMYEILAKQEENTQDDLSE